MDPNAQDNGGAAGPDAVGPATTAVGVLHAGSESTFAAGGAAAIGGDGGGASADTAVVAEPTRGAPSTVAQVPGGPTGDWDGAAGMQLIDLSRAASPVAQLVGSGRDSVPLGLAAERSVQGSPSVPLVLSPSQLAAAGASSSSPPSGREDSSLGSSSSPTLSPQPVAAAVPPTRAGSASEFHDRGSSPPSGREDSSLGSSPSLRTLSPRGAGGAEDTPVASSPAESGSAHSGASDNEGPQAGPAAVEASGASAASPQGAKPHPKPPHIHSLRVQTTSDADAPRPTPRVATKKASELPGWGGSQRLRRRRYSTGSAPVHLAPEARKNEPFESYLSRFMSRRAQFQLSNGMVQPHMAQLWPLLFRSRAPRAEAATTDLITRGPALRGLRKSRSWTQSSDGASAREEQERRRRCELFGPDTERIDAAAIQRVPMSDKRIVRTRTLMRNRPDTMRGAGIIVSTLKALVREGHADGVVYVVALESQPRANVSVRIVTSTMGDALNIFPSQLLFTPDDWEMPRLVHMSAVSDVVIAHNLATQKGGLYSELRRAYKPAKRGKATVIHLSESSDQRFGASLVIQPIKVMIAKQLSGMVWACGTASHGKLGLNVKATACVDTPYQLTDLPQQAELQQYLSKVSLRSVPFRPRAAVPTGIGIASRRLSGGGNGHSSMADKWSAFEQAKAWDATAVTPPPKPPEPTDDQLDSIDAAPLDQVHESAWTRHRRKIRARAHAARVAVMRRQVDERATAATAAAEAAGRTGSPRAAGLRSPFVGSLNGGAAPRPARRPVPLGPSMRHLLDMVHVKPQHTVWKDVRDSQAASEDGYFMSFKEFPPGWEDARPAEDKLSRSSGSRTSIGTSASNVTLGSPISRAPHSPRSPRAGDRRRSSTRSAGGSDKQAAGAGGKGRRQSVEAFTEGEERAALLTLRARALGVAARLVHHARENSASKRRIPDAPGGFSADVEDEPGAPNFSSSDSSDSNEGGGRHHHRHSQPHLEDVVIAGATTVAPPAHGRHVGAVIQHPNLPSLAAIARKRARKYMEAGRQRLHLAAQARRKWQAKVKRRAQRRVKLAGRASGAGDGGVSGSGSDHGSGSGGDATSGNDSGDGSAQGGSDDGQQPIADAAPEASAPAKTAGNRAASPRRPTVRTSKSPPARSKSPSRGRGRGRGRRRGKQTVSVKRGAPRRWRRARRRGSAPRRTRARRHGVSSSSSDSSHLYDTSSSSSSDDIYGGQRQRQRQRQRRRRSNAFLNGSSSPRGGGGGSPRGGNNKVVQDLLANIMRGSKAGERWASLRSATNTGAHKRVLARVLAQRKAHASSPAAGSGTKASLTAQPGKDISTAAGKTPPKTAFHAMLAKLAEEQKVKRRTRATEAMAMDPEQRHAMYPPLVHFPAKPPGRRVPVPSHRRMTRDRVHGMVKFSTVAAGERHSAGVTGSGKLFVWGAGDDGVLGVGTQAGYAVPVLVRDLSRLVVTGVACGAAHTLACSSDGAAFAWGSNRLGQLGISPDAFLVAASPMAVEALAHELVTKVAAGDGHSLFLTAGSTLWSSGDNRGGQLGVGDRHTRFVAERVTRGLQRNAKVFGLAAGAAHSACVDNRGVCYTWGYGANGRLGHGDTSDRLEPTQVVAFAKLRSRYTFLLRDVSTKVAEARRSYVKSVFCGGAHTAALSVDLRLYTWGLGSSGQLGHGDTKSRLLPKEVRGMVGTNVSHVSLGQLHSAACTYDGMLYTWGLGELGALMHDFTFVARSISRPRLVQRFVGLDVFDVACGHNHTIALTDQHAVSENYQRKALLRHKELVKSKHASAQRHDKQHRAALLVRAGVKLRGKLQLLEGVTEVASDSDTGRDSGDDSGGTTTSNDEAPAPLAAARRRRRRNSSTTSRTSRRSSTSPPPRRARRRRRGSSPLKPAHAQTMRSTPRRHVRESPQKRKRRLAACSVATTLATAAIAQAAAATASRQPLSPLRRHHPTWGVSQHRGRPSPLRSPPVARPQSARRARDGAGGSPSPAGPYRRRPATASRARRNMREWQETSASAQVGAHTRPHSARPYRPLVSPYEQQPTYGGLVHRARRSTVGDFGAVHPLSPRQSASPLREPPSPPSPLRAKSVSPSRAAEPRASDVAGGGGSGTPPPRPSSGPRNSSSTPPRSTRRGQHQPQQSQQPQQQPQQPCAHPPRSPIRASPSVAAGGAAAARGKADASDGGGGPRPEVGAEATTARVRPLLLPTGEPVMQAVSRARRKSSPRAQLYEPRLHLDRVDVAVTGRPSSFRFASGPTSVGDEARPNGSSPRVMARPVSAMAALRQQGSRRGSLTQAKVAEAINATAGQGGSTAPTSLLQFTEGPDFAHVPHSLRNMVSQSLRHALPRVLVDPHAPLPLRKRGARRGSSRSSGRGSGKSPRSGGWRSAPPRAGAVGGRGASSRSTAAGDDGGADSTLVPQRPRASSAAGGPVAAWRQPSPPPDSGPPAASRRRPQSARPALRGRKLVSRVVAAAPSAAASTRAPAPRHSAAGANRRARENRDSSNTRPPRGAPSSPSVPSAKKPQARRRPSSARTTKPTRLSGSARRSGSRPRGSTGSTDSTSPRFDSGDRGNRAPAVLAIGARLRVTPVPKPWSSTSCEV